ncbi:MAG: M20 family metallopeptidase [Planctomycetota bacterium]|jgi:acetylornithine deacetylase
MVWAEEAFRALGIEVTPVPMNNSLREDEDYSSPIPDIEYEGRFNLRLRLPGSGGGRSLLLNSHTDVVPPSTGQENPYEPVIRDGILFGRGACDAKGQIATIYLIFAALKKLGVTLKGDLIAHAVNEEENGGNGTLAMVRAGEEADACIVLEPTTNKIFSSVRGAVWFRLRCEGKAGHSGRAGDTVSALTLARKAMDVLEQYHADLLAASRGLPLFDKYPNPMPITFGRCTAGDWPATAPAKATVEGVLGLLPNKTRHEVMAEMRKALDNCGDERLKERVELEFMYRHDSHVLDPEHDLVKDLQAVCGAWEVPVEVDAMTASCDSWFYNNQLGIPSVVYGPGTLGVAHSNEEQIPLAAIAEAGGVLTAFAAAWCDSEK